MLFHGVRPVISWDVSWRNLQHQWPPNYRATCVARSRAEFIAKLGLVFEEIDESEFWLDVSIRKGLGDKQMADGLHKEAIELRAIFGRSLSTARKNSTILKSSITR